MNHAKGFNNPKERARILMQYGGIFPNHIKAFAEKVIPKHKKLVNHSR